ncbi:MAG: hypothetical protein HGA33_06015 [Candidatus Moranbacteria bacterium]|nr:hypothetical protein [Candidatus Moranbacteria bacterium]
MQANGVMRPGTIDFGVAEELEEWIITEGKVKHDGKIYSKKTKKADRLRFKPGDKVVIECVSPATYKCRLGKKPKKM